MDVSGNTNHTKKALEYNYKLIGAVYHEFMLISLFDMACHHGGIASFRW